MDALIDAAKLVACPTCGARGAQDCVQAKGGFSPKQNMVIEDGSVRGPHPKRISVAKKLGILQLVGGEWVLLEGAARTPEQQQLIGSMRGVDGQKVAIGIYMQYRKTPNNNAAERAREMRELWIERMQQGKASPGGLTRGQRGKP